MTEGNSGTTTATFTVTLSAASDQRRHRQLRDRRRHRHRGQDYVAQTGTLTFAAGSTTNTIAVTVNGDTTVEAERDVLGEPDQPRRAPPSLDAQGVGTIVNDDVTPPSGAQPVVWTSCRRRERNGNSLTDISSSGTNAGAVSDSADCLR